MPDSGHAILFSHAVFHYIAAQSPLAHCTHIYNSMNYESLPFHRSWNALPDVQIILRVITTAQAGYFVQSQASEPVQTSGGQPQAGRNKEKCCTFQSNTVAATPDAFPSEGHGTPFQTTKKLVFHSALCSFSDIKSELIDNCGPPTCRGTWPSGQRTYYRWMYTYSTAPSTPFLKASDSL